MGSLFDLGHLEDIRRYIETKEGKLRQEVAAHIDYTMRHKRAILILDTYYNHPYGIAGYKRLLYHDVDKLFMYGVIKDTKQAHNLHVGTSIHHCDNWIPGDNFGRYETVLDYESARYTKPDKPLNAYATICKYHPYTMTELQPYLVNLGIDSSTNRDMVNPTFAKYQEEELLNVTISLINRLYAEYNSGTPLATILERYNRDQLK